MLQKYDPRNADIKVWVGGELLPREEAKISVFDSLVQGGDGVWEGLRVYDGRIFSLEEHLDRMQESARRLSFADIPTKDEIKAAIFETLRANDMRDGVHIRLTLSRGLKITSGMDPRLNQFGSTLIVLAEHKPPVYDAGGISLATSAIRRNSPLSLDSNIHHNNLLNNILAKIEANAAGVDDAIMLDYDDFVSETNATNIFAIIDNTLATPIADYCLPGITRGLVLKIATELELPNEVRRITVNELHSSSGVFVTGTMGELVPVHNIDGKPIHKAEEHPIFQQIAQKYRQLTQTEGEMIPS